MTTAAEKSSLPLLLGLTGAVLAVVGVGWFYLDSEPASAPTEPAWTVSSEPEPPLDTVAGDAGSGSSGESQEAGDSTDLAAPVADEPVTSVDADLRKARLAAGADILVFPESESALFYYNRVLQANPGDTVVTAEVAAVLASVETSVESLLNEERFDDAYEIAAVVTRYAPEHSLVTTTTEVLDQRSSGFIDQALEQARAGDDQASDEAFRSAAALPGRNAQYLAAVRSSIADIRQARADAARDRERRAQLRADEARQAWLEAVRRSITDGHLLTPTGASAVDLLAEENSWATEREQLTGELRDAIVAAFDEGVNAGNLDESDRLLKAILELGADAEVVDEMSASLDSAFIEVEENRVTAVSEMVQVRRVAPRFPKTALNRGQSGWVELFFTVTPDGETTDISVRASEPGELFDNAAIRAVEKWEFEPYEYRGQLISKRIGTKLVFNIEE
ncbi:MAG: energy transducer TonB [Woeseiaceae bacterium]|nr:energy transducer TonB [Woeseiaceae bacterium]